MAGIDKKYIKIGVVAFATVALVIGLSVGITQSKKNKSNVAAKAAATDGYSGAATYDEVVLKDCTSSSSKSGKSGGGKSGKSGGSSSSRDQRIVVPDTEEYGVEKDSGKRRKLRNELIRGLKDNDGDDDDDDDGDDDGDDDDDDDDDDDGDADDDDDGDDDDDDDDDGSISSSSKSSKSGGSKSSSSTSRDYCKKPADICSSSFSPGSSKSGKSGGGKSGKSGGSSSSSKRADTMSMIRPSSNYCSSSKSGKLGGGKSGKSGGGKSGKSGGSSGSSTMSRHSTSKSGKSTSSDDDYECIARTPSVCAPPDYKDTPAPTPCVCEDRGWGVLEGKCQQSCEEYDGEAADSAKDCCETNYSSDVKECMGAIVNTCIEAIITSPPTPTVTEYTDTPAPTPCVCEDRGWGVIDGKCQQSCEEYDGEAADTVDGCCETNYGSDEVDQCVEASVDTCITVMPTLVPTPVVTDGSTPTVSTAASGPPTVSRPTPFKP